MYVPQLGAANEEGMLGVWANAGDVRRTERRAAPQVQRVPPLAMRLVVFKANERQRSNIDLLWLAVGLQHVKHGIEIGRLRRLEEIAVFIALARRVPSERVVAVGPPEARAVVLVVRQHLLRQRLADEGLHREVVIEHVEHLSAVLEEEPVADALIADAVADDQIIGAVDRDPAIAAV